METGTQLRIRAEDLMRAEDDEGLLALLDQLRDDEFWGRMWAPGCAVAARRLGRTGLARQLLGEAIAAGFFQPEIFDGEIEKAFAGESDWPQLQAQLAANRPAAPLQIATWPSVTPKLPLVLYRMAEAREERLKPLLPELSGPAWSRATGLAHWVARRWTHANDHVDGEQDALDVLHHVDADGMRFACVEYSIVLCHALNASGIPSRRLALRQPDYHAGWGKGHVVSEAWLDDLGKWVVLDGQNGAYWAYAEDEPLSALELQEALAEGRRPQMLGADGPLKPSSAEWWFSYFHHITTTGATWARPPFIPHFQHEIRPSPLLAGTPEDAYPDLGEIGISMDVRDGKAAVRLSNRHPFASGYAVRQAEHTYLVDAADPVWTLPMAAGAYRVAISVTTALGTLPPRPLVFRVA